MLVKFLSFVASVIGTARYKSLAVACLVLILTFTGIGGAAIWRGGGGQSAASSTLEQPDAQADTQQGSPQVKEGRKQAIQSEGTGPSPTDQQTGTTTPNTSSEPKPKTTSSQDAPIEIAVSKTEVAVPAGGKSELLVAKSALPDKAQWSILAVDAPDISVTTEKQSDDELTFYVNAKQGIETSRPYQIILQIKDTDQTTVLATKTLAIIVK